MLIHSYIEYKNVYELKKYVQKVEMKQKYWCFVFAVVMPANAITLFALNQ